jgi:hypothetical protein
MVQALARTQKFDVGITALPVVGFHFNRTLSGAMEH